jgi:uncharacterized protein (DUF2267 family)
MNIEKHAATAHAFLLELAEETGRPGDRDHAGRVLRCVLHTLRRRLTPEESLDLVAQLPVFIKGMYVDGWRISTCPDRTLREPHAFARALLSDDRRAGARVFSSADAALRAAQAVFRVIGRAIAEHESAQQATHLSSVLMHRG